MEAVATRTKKSTINLMTGIFSQLVILVLNFVIRYIFIEKIGYEYLGINSLFSGILTILSVADLGFGSALGIVLYSSLAKKDETEIAGLMNFFKKVYFVIGFIVTAAGLIITPFVKFLVNTETEVPNLSFYFLLFLANTISSYFVSYRAILIRADQKNSVVNNVTTGVKIAKAILEAVVLIVGPKLIGLTLTYIAYLLVMVVATYAIGIITSVYAGKKYSYAFQRDAVVNGEKKKEIISTTKYLFIYRLCSAFSTPIDSILISLFVGTTLLGVYSNYLLIFTTLMEFICLVSRNVISSVGNFVVEKPIEEQKKLYFEMQMVYFAIIIFCVVNFVALASPFISLVFKEENSLSNWVVFLLGTTLFSRCSTELAIIFRETTKIYKKTKYISLIYTIVHIGLSVLFGNYMGLEGVLLGNVVAYFATNFWFEIFALFKWHFKESSAKVFIQHFYIIFITTGLSVAMYYACASIANKGGLLYFALAAIASLVVSLIALVILYPIDGFMPLFNRVKGIVENFRHKFERIYKSKRLQTLIVVGYIVLLTGFIFARDLLGFNINKFIFLILMVIVTLLLRKDKAIAVILFTLPISPSLAELYIFIYALAYIFVVEYKKYSLQKITVVLGIPLIVFLMEIFLSFAYGTIQLQLALRIFVLLSILGFIYYDKHLFTKKTLYAFIGGCLYLLGIIAVDWVVPAVYGITHRGSTTWLTLNVLLKGCRLGFSTLDWIETHAGVSYPFRPINMVAENPNNIGLISIVGITTILCVFGTERGKKKFYLTLAIVAFVLFGIWSQSRTFILVSLVLIIVSIFAPVFVKRRQLLNSFIYLSLVVITILLIIMFNQGIIKLIIDRFFEEDTSSGNGRLSLIPQYFGFIFSDWRYALFGLSCANLEPKSGLDLVPHTNFVQLIGAYGILFTTFLITAIVISFKRTKQVSVREPKIYLCGPIVFTVFFTFTLQLFLPSVILISFIPGVLCLSLLNKENVPGKEIIYHPVKPRTIEENQIVNVAMCSGSFGGGIASYIINVSKHLNKELFNESLIFNPDTTTSELEKYNQFKVDKYIYEQKKKHNKLVRLFQKFNYYCRCFDKTQPDIIYINTSSYTRSAIQFFAAVRYRRSHIVIHCHNAVNSKSKLPIRERISRWFMSFAYYSRFACSVESGKDFFGKKFLVEKNHNDQIVNNFIDSQKFKFDYQNRQEIREKFNIKDNTMVIGCVGRLSKEKNQSFLIKLMESLPRNYVLFIIGSGPLKVSLNKAISDLKLNKRVFMVDNTPDVYKYYSAFDFFALPSFIEGLPFVSVEAQCNGLANIINESLPHSTDLTGNVIFKKLIIEEWKETLLNEKPLSFENRLVAYKKIDEACYSNKTAPKKIIEQIRKAIYE